MFFNVPATVAEEDYLENDINQFVFSMLLRMVWNVKAPATVWDFWYIDTDVKVPATVAEEEEQEQKEEQPQEAKCQSGQNQTKLSFNVLF